MSAWSRAPDQIQMYPDWDTIAQLLPTRQIQQHDCLRESITKHLMYGPSGN